MATATWTGFAGDILAPLALAAAIGFLLGLDREVRGIHAGVRTHMLIALSSAIAMLVAAEIERGLAARGGQADPLRAVQGLAQVIGFLCAGVVFVARGSVHGITTAASLWMASVLGIATGAGLYRIAVAGLVFALVVVTLMWLMKSFYPRFYEVEKPDVDRP